MASRYEEELAAERLRARRHDIILLSSIVLYVLIGILSFAWCVQRPVPDRDAGLHVLGSIAAGAGWPVWLIGSVAMVVTAPREG
jgi:hypothetical protein